MRCPVCGGAHTAWSPQCPRRQKELQRTHQRLKNKATLYDTTGLRTTQSTAGGTTDSEGFVTVIVGKPSKKRKAMNEIESNEVI